MLGISNVSFGLPTAGREVLNSVFLYHCVQAGLDLALVNSEKLERYPQIPDAEKQLCEDLLYNRGADPITPVRGALPRAQAARPRVDAAQLPLDERLARYIIEGSQATAWSPTWRPKLAEGATPLEIINGPLMKGMDEVGRLFGNNELIVAEVLQSAEAMKAAVSYLEPKMDKAATAVRGQGAARHGEGRRARHRQEPGRDHPRQQRLRGGEPGHQGAARAADGGGEAAPARHRSGCRGCW